ncbi:MAG: hypothetical protein SOW20_08320 [Berryella intestinalis]|uniref:hypothetical protein n=1 Tax=Berryella intestinalis TaxID=1531429 RepID=UPI002A75BDEF|nr:hypothetical protein [Berryella intestinalis]MDY3130006.1 hypothetical protein [Berryella intestinalis]
MAQTKGYTHYACDRCGKSAFMVDGSAEAREWREVRRVTAGGSESVKLLCPECRKSYEDLVTKHDILFNSFMRREEV